jgi:hypothetical protein
VFNTTFSNISAISWRPVLVVDEAGVPVENHQPWAESGVKHNKIKSNQIKSNLHTKQCRWMLFLKKKCSFICMSRLVLNRYSAVCEIL